MGFLDSVKNVLRGAVAAPSSQPEQAPAETVEAAAGTPADEPSYDVYTIRTGDTLGEIGARHGIARDELARLNGIDEPDLIFPGQEIRVPTR